MQKLGQHFLKNATVLETIVGAIAPKDGDHIIEIGPGHGELTMPLLRAAEKYSCTLTSIERDALLIPALAALQKKYADGRFTVAEGDALTLLPTIVRGLSHAGADGSGGVKYKIAGNIPYYITGHLLRIMGELEPRPERAVLLVQKEVALRLSAAPPHMNRLAASVQFWADARIVAAVPRHDFSPPPDVDSAVILLTTKKTDPGVDPALYYRAVRAIFAQPRKTILNNISAGANRESADGKDKTILSGLIEKACVDPAARPQDLSIAQVIALARDIKWG